MENIKIKKFHICDQPHNHWCEHIYSPYYVNSPHNSKHMFDIYSLTHIFWPLLFSWIIKKIVGKNDCIFIAMIIITTLFEIHENIPQNIIRYRRVEINKSGHTSYRGDSTINIIGDILMNFAGIYIGFQFDNNFLIGMILIITFLIIIMIVGVNYWIEFIQYLTFMKY